MEEILKQILAKLNDMEEENRSLRQEVAERFDRIETELEEFKAEVAERFDHVDKRFDGVENVVRMSAEDILENQVEEVARHNLHEDKIHSLEATTFRIDKAVLELKRRVDRIEKANEQ
ncbi:hypothetical protein EDC32_101971 [Laceyella sacchari]|jgi:hypothetical protein|uniref:hypothetical protein n=1 Tax=Laceyella sacchari TaxID=37482 RepID=UPI001052EC6C|nr:hypothetical protein [Laceyella sacchari]TCW41309.1 hypothetical protein EDC32_101971 [Laceyella sacchari]